MAANKVYEIHAYGDQVSRKWFVDCYRNGDEISVADLWIDYIERVPFESVADYMENDVECMRTIVLNDSGIQIFETVAHSFEVDELGLPVDGGEWETYYIGNATRVITKNGEEIFSNFDEARERILYLLGIYE